MPVVHLQYGFMAYHICGTSTRCCNHMVISNLERLLLLCVLHTLPNALLIELSWYQPLLLQCTQGTPPFLCWRIDRIFLLPDFPSHIVGFYSEVCMKLQSAVEYTALHKFLMWDLYWKKINGEREERERERERLCITGTIVMQLLKYLQSVELCGIVNSCHTMFIPLIQFCLTIFTFRREVVNPRIHHLW